MILIPLINKIIRAYITNRISYVTHSIKSLIVFGLPQ